MKALAFAVLWPGCQERLSVVKSQAAHSLAFNAADSLFNSPVCEAAYCFFPVSVSRVNGYNGSKNKEKITDYRRWNLGSEAQKTHLQFIWPADYNYHWLVRYVSRFIRNRDLCEIWRRCSSWCASTVEWTNQFTFKEKFSVRWVKRI